MSDKKVLTENRAIIISNVIEDALEDKELNDWEVEFLESIQKQLKYKNDLSRKQWDKLIDIVPEVV